MLAKYAVILQGARSERDIDQAFRRKGVVCDYLELGVCICGFAGAARRLNK